MIVRTLTAADAEPVAALIRTAFAALSAPVDPPPSALRETAENVARLIENGGGAGADIDGTLAGAILWQDKPTGLYAGRLSVSPAHRGHGIAKALIAAAEAAARARGHRTLLLSTRLAFTDNRRLFASLGFIEVAEHAHAGYAHNTFVDLEKPLA